MSKNMIRCLLEN